MFAYSGEKFKSYAPGVRIARLLAAPALPLALLAGCGSEESADTAGTAAETEAGGVPGDADAEAEQVIAAWAEALRRGDVESAASYFAIPSVAENGPLLVRIRSEADAVSFNESLPCGGRLIRAEGEGDFTTATFRLTERPGPGTCGPGTGETAKAAFVIRDGEIVEWRRVGVEPPAAPGQAASKSSLPHPQPRYAVISPHLAPPRYRMGSAPRLTHGAGSENRYCGEESS
jgi:hypothetical protein